MSWAAVTWTAIGAGVGAGVGQLAGGDTKSTLTGAGIGAAAGLGGYAMFGGAGAGATGATAEGVSMEAANASMYGSGLGMGSEAATSTAAGGLTMGNAMLLGQAGLGLASAFSSQGTAFQDKISLTTEGKSLRKDYAANVKADFEKRSTGDVNDLAFSDISRAKTAEGQRSRGFEAATQMMNATIDNRPSIDRGGVTKGGNTITALAQGAGERMTGLFAPSSILNNYQREGLMNSVKNIQNLQALDNQVAQFNYGGNLAAWSANQNLSTQKGAAVGSVLSGVGSGMMNQAYYNRMSAIAS